MVVKRVPGEEDQAWQMRRAELSAATHKKMMVLFHAVVQVRMSCSLRFERRHAFVT